MFGPEGRAALLAQAGLYRLPAGDAMIPEGEAARLHRHLRRVSPRLSVSLAEEAGRRTADYILEHRIPRAAQVALRVMPAPLAARALSRAIAAHAWTFAGTGRFEAVTPWSFEIEQNPLIAGETSTAPLCHWHAAVFARLYQVLVHQGTSCLEVECAAQPGRDRCRFDLVRHAA